MQKKKAKNIDLIVGTAAMVLTALSVLSSF